MSTYLSAMLIIGLVLLGWVAVQQMARHFAARHPELGAYREAGRGCGGQCGCNGLGCGNDPEAVNGRLRVRRER